MSGLQLIGLIFTFVQAYFTFLHFKRGEFTLRECLGWMSIWLVFGAVTLFPEFFKVVAGNFGALRPLDFFTILGFIVILSISFYTYVSVDRLRKSLEKAVRELALKKDEK